MPDRDAGLIAGVFNAVPAVFQEQALLGIHQLSFGGRDAEEEGIELVDILQHAHPLTRGFAGGLGIGIVEMIQRPARRGNLRDAVPATRHVFPEVGNRRRHGKLARHADDGDAFQAGIDAAPFVTVRFDHNGEGRCRSASARRFCSTRRWMHGSVRSTMPSAVWLITTLPMCRPSPTYARASVIRCTG